MILWFYDSVLNENLPCSIEGLTAQALPEILKSLEAAVIFLGLHMKSTILYCTLIASYVSCN